MAADDAVLPATRVTAAIVVAALVTAVIILYGAPGATERWWAWPIAPDLTALVMGAGYASGAYFFTRVLTTRSWRSVTTGFLPITAFTVFMLAATILHWDRFTHDHPAFFAWTFLYVVTPVLVPVLWAVNRRRDPGPGSGEIRLPRAVRGVLVVAGGAVAALAVVIMISPSAVYGWWPWELTALTARVISSYLLLTGASLLSIAMDARWEASKVLVESLIIGTALLTVAVIRDWASILTTGPLRWVNLVLWIVLLLLFAGLHRWMAQQQRPASPAVAPR
jgi:hypothetical protein